MIIFMAVIWEFAVKNSLKADQICIFHCKNILLHNVLDSYKNKYIQPIQYCTIVENIHNQNNLFLKKNL